MSGRDLTEEEKLAWAAATQRIRPLSGKHARPLRSTSSGSHKPEGKASPSSRRSSNDAKRAAPENRQNERAVRRGQQRVSATFDLHGHSQDSAWRALPIFLRQAQASRAKCVIVITGKGRMGNGVLRRNFLHWLEMPQAAELVSGYAPAHPKHGGTGAWYVYLRRP